MAKVMGNLAMKKPKHGEKLSGILVKRNFNYHILAPSDLSGLLVIFNLKLWTGVFVLVFIFA